MNDTNGLPVVKNDINHLKEDVKVLFGKHEGDASKLDEHLRDCAEQNGKIIAEFASVKRLMWAQVVSLLGILAWIIRGAL